MNNLSNERLKEIVGYQPGGENYATRAEWMEMARELLAYREAAGKPVGYTWNRGVSCEIVAADLYDNCPAGIDLYAASQIPVSPDEPTDDERIMAIEGVIPTMPSGNSPEIPDCWCHACNPQGFGHARFVVCPDCGNKRCPKANNHMNACTGSNEPGQEGSAYPAAPTPNIDP